MFVLKLKSSFIGFNFAEYRMGNRIYFCALIKDAAKFESKIEAEMWAGDSIGEFELIEIN